MAKSIGLVANHATTVSDRDIPGITVVTAGDSLVRIPPGRAEAGKWAVPTKERY